MCLRHDQQWIPLHTGSVIRFQPMLIRLCNFWFMGHINIDTVHLFGHKIVAFASSHLKLVCTLAVSWPWWCPWHILAPATKVDTANVQNFRAESWVCCKPYEVPGTCTCFRCLQIKTFKFGLSRTCSHDEAGQGRTESSPVMFFQNAEVCWLRLTGCFSRCFWTLAWLGNIYLSSFTGSVDVSPLEWNWYIWCLWHLTRLYFAIFFSIFSWGAKDPNTDSLYIYISVLYLAVAFLLFNHRAIQVGITAAFGSKSLHTASS